jgi:hypothetical protein
MENPVYKKEALMKMERAFSPWVSILIALMFGIVLTGVIWAQEPAPAAPASAPTMSSEIPWIVIPHRSQEEINNDLQNARTTYDAARARHDKALEMQVQVEPLVAGKKAEIDSLSRALDSAKKEKREVDATKLEGMKKVAEQLRDALQQQKSLRTAEVEAAQAEMDWATASQKALEDEMTLAKKREGGATDSSTVTSGSSSAATALLIKEIETRALANQKVQAEMLNKMAEKNKDVVDLRMKLAETVAKVSGGK